MPKGNEKSWFSRRTVGRRQFWLILLTVLFLALFGMSLLFQPERSLSPGAWDKVQPGMGPTEVVQLLGPPHSTREYGWASFWLYRGGPSETDPKLVTCALVKFRPDGTVESIVSGEEDRPTMADYLRAWLRRLW